MYFYYLFITFITLISIINTIYQTLSSSPLMLLSSLIFKSEFDSFKSVKILQVLKDLKIISSEIASQKHLTHKHTLLILAQRKFLITVFPAPLPAIHICHSL